MSKSANLKSSTEALSDRTFVPGLKSRATEIDQPERKGEVWNATDRLHLAVQHVFNLSVAIERRLEPVMSARAPDGTEKELPETGVELANNLEAQADRLGRASGILQSVLERLAI